MTTGSTFRALLEGSPDLRVRCTSETDGTGKYHWLQLGVWTEDGSRSNISAEAFEIAALLEFAISEGETWTLRPQANQDAAVSFTADLQVGDAAEKKRVNAFLNSAAGWAHTVEDVLAQTHSLSTTLLRRSWRPSLGEECNIDYVPGKEHNWERLDPALEVVVPKGTPDHRRTALLFAMAMKVQRGMPANERWVASTCTADGRAFVTLQVVTHEAPEAADIAEIARCMALLNEVASGQGKGGGFL